MTGTTDGTARPAPDRPWARDVVGPRTKGLRLDGPATVADVLEGAPRLTDDTFSWPLLTLDDATLDHNVGVVARVCAERGVEHAPHVKTTMSRALYARQAAAGAWGATVATPVQLRTVRDWGVPRVLLANELLDPREIAWLRDDLSRVVEGAGDEVWLCVDSPHGVDLLARGFADAPAAARARLGVLVELGVPGGRTGVRSTAAALDLARAICAAGLRLLGVTGYEGSVAGGTGADELAAVAAWCDGLRDLGAAFVREGLAGVDEPLVLSAGGSSFLDVVLAELPGPVPGPRSAAEGTTAETRVVVRSGAYVTHDHGFYARTDPWSRIPGAEPLRGAATVWGQVLSVPEPGLAICGVGRRDVSFDIDLPVALWLRSQSDDGWLPARELAGTRVTALNDQHLYLALDADEAGASHVTGPATAQVRPGDVVGFGISHPCTTFDRWRVAAVVRGDEVVDLATVDL